jgi:hypothetical protein
VPRAIPAAFVGFFHGWQLDKCDVWLFLLLGFSPCARGWTVGNVRAFWRQSILDNISLPIFAKAARHTAGIA